MNKIMLFAVCLAGSVLSANAQSSIAVPYNTIKVQKNVETSFTVQLTSESVSALQAGLSEVENLTINGAASETGDTIKYSATSNIGTPIVVTYNFNNPTEQPSQTPFASGKLFTVKVKAGEAFTTGSMTITPTASAVGGEGVTVAPITVDVFKNGDANKDGAVDATDVVMVRDNVLGGAGYAYIADANDDTQVDATDVVIIRDGVLGGAMAKDGQVDLGE